MAARKSAVNSLTFRLTHIDITPRISATAGIGQSVWESNHISRMHRITGNSPTIFQSYFIFICKYNLIINSNLPVHTSVFLLIYPLVCGAPILSACSTSSNITEWYISLRSWWFDKANLTLQSICTVTFCIPYIIIGFSTFQIHACWTEHWLTTSKLTASWSTLMRCSFEISGVSHLWNISTRLCLGK